MNNVLCFKWGDKYSPRYVNNLYCSFVNNTTVPFRFVCITEDANGLNKGIEALPLLDESCPGWWQKVTAFKNPLHDIEGFVLLIDLDMIIVDNVDCFFQEPGDFIMEQDYIPRNRFSTCVMRFIANQNEDIYNEMPREQWKETRFGFFNERYWGDQMWVSEKRPHSKIWPLEWVKSYKWECLSVREQPQSHFFIPPGCKIIKFHGSPSIEKVLPYNHINRFWDHT